MAKSKEQALVKRSTNTALEPWEEEESRHAKDVRSKETLGMPRITHRGGEFKVNDKPAGRSLKVVVVAEKYEKQFYLNKFDPNKPGQTPDCYAFGDDPEKGMAPHEMSRAKQNADCPTCPHNRFGTADIGRGKKCKDYRRLGVLSPIINPDGTVKLDANGVMQTEKHQLAVPPASLKGWGNYLNGPVQDKSPTGSVSGVVTQIDTYSLKSGGHGLAFSVVQAISKEALQAIRTVRPQVEQMLIQPYPNIEAEVEEPEETQAQRKKIQKKLK